jgi:DNA-binding transcriptional ArsR family regulator
MGLIENISKHAGVPPRDVLVISESLLVITSPLSPEKESLVRALCGSVQVQFTKKTEPEPPKTINPQGSPISEPSEGSGRVPWRKLDTNHVSRLAALVRSSEDPLGADAVLVLLALFCHTSKNPECYPSTFTLCRITKMSRSHAFQQLKKLEQLRLIERRRTGRDNRYRIPALPPD